MKRVSSITAPYSHNYALNNLHTLNHFLVDELCAGPGAAVFSGEEKYKTGDTQ